MTTVRKGFTLIELLVVIAIIALLSTLAVVALNNARQKARDAKRVSDVKQMQTALELYFFDQNSYPTASAVTMGGATTKCLSSGGGIAATCSGTSYMPQVPSSPGTDSYVYTSSVSTDYSLTFSLEGQTGSLASGAHTANPSGIQ